MTVKNATEFVELVGNRLGWTAPGVKPYWKERAIEAGKLNRKIATNPRLFTWENLEATVDVLARERREVKSPAAVCWHVERALQRARQEPLVDAEIEGAIGREISVGDPEGWAVRLSRSFGSGRAEVLKQWRAERAPSLEGIS